MSSPSTKRDQRREARRQHYVQQQAERRHVRERAIRQQRIWRIGIWVAAVIVLGLLIWGGVAWYAAAHAPVQHTQPATGQMVDGVACTSSEGQVAHYHANLQIYVNGHAQPLPAGVGIVEPAGSPGPALGVGSPACLYALHTHDATGIVHIESPVANHVYQLGNFFDIWGKSLSRNSFMGLPVSSAKNLHVVLYDAHGSKSVYTGDPSTIQLAAHETIFLLYNSPNAVTAPYTNWANL
jgi:hypothetical protein